MLFCDDESVRRTFLLPTSLCWADFGVGSLSSVQDAVNDYRERKSRMDIFPSWNEISSVVKVIHGIIFLLLCGVFFGYMIKRRLSLHVCLFTLFFAMIIVGALVMTSLYLIDWTNVWHVVIKGQISGSIP